MLVGLAIVVISVLAIAFSAYRIGGSACEPDVQNRDVTRNMSLVVIALGVMCTMFGVLVTMTGSMNPFNSLTGSDGPRNPRLAWLATHVPPEFPPFVVKEFPRKGWLLLSDGITCTFLTLDDTFVRTRAVDRWCEGHDVTRYVSFDAYYNKE